MIQVSAFTQFIIVDTLVVISDTSFVIGNRPRVTIKIVEVIGKNLDTKDKKQPSEVSRKISDFVPFNGEIFLGQTVLPGIFEGIVFWCDKMH